MASHILAGWGRRLQEAANGTLAGGAAPAGGGGYNASGASGSATGGRRQRLRRLRQADKKALFMGPAW